MVCEDLVCELFSAHPNHNALAASWKRLLDALPLLPVTSAENRARSGVQGPVSDPQSRTIPALDTRTNVHARRPGHPDA
jgi:hypothetical protein